MSEWWFNVLVVDIVHDTDPLSRPTVETTLPL